MVAAIRHTDFSRFVAAAVVKNRNGQATLKSLLVSEPKVGPAARDARSAAAADQPVHENVRRRFE